MAEPTLFINANVIPLSGPHERASELAVADGRILAVGRRVPRELRAHSRVIDLAGATLLPAFVDSHTHWLGAGLMLIGLRLDGAADHAELAGLIKAARRERGRGSWLVGLGAADNSMPERRLPSREELDVWVGDAPLLIERADGHGCAINSRALEKLDLPVDTPGLDARQGLLLAEANALAMPRAQAAVAKRHPVSALRAVARLALSKGVGTAVCMEGFDVPLDLDVRATALAGLLDRPRLRLFVQSFDVARIRRLGQSRAGGCFNLALDGSFSSHTAALSRPFSDRPDANGRLFHSDEKIRAFVEQAHLAGMQVAIHAIGDRAIEQALRAYEAVLAAHPRPDHRHRIEHAEIPRPEQIERIGALGLHLAVQPAFLDMPTTPTDYLRAILGPRRFHGYLPLRAYLDAGVDLSGGSDAPVSLIDPLRGVHMAVNHPNRGQALTAYEALRLFTLGGARSVFEERCRGTLEPGLDADLVVLTDDPTRVPAERIERIEVLATYINGRRVYSAGRDRN